MHINSIKVILNTVEKLAGVAIYRQMYRFNTEISNRYIRARANKAFLPLICFVLPALCEDLQVIF